MHLCRALRPALVKRHAIIAREKQAENGFIKEDHIEGRFDKETHCFYKAQSKMRNSTKPYFVQRQRAAAVFIWPVSGQRFQQYRLPIQNYKSTCMCLSADQIQFPCKSAKARQRARG